MDGKHTTLASGSDADFLRWVATWLDRIDPILRAVYAKSPALTGDERERIDAWLRGSDVQERLRNLASRLEPRGPVTTETVRRLEDCGSFALADIARRYAVDRPRWWHRLKRGTA